MSWASRRRTSYLTLIILFFALVIGIPLAHHFLSIQPTCFDGRQDGGETAVDEGGPCLKLDPAALSPVSTLWARAFQVRTGSYTAVAYLENTNPTAGVAQANYDFGLYDSDNVLIADATGTTSIMPGGITPVLLTGIDTGNRVVVHTYIQLTDPVLDWQRVSSPASAIGVGDVQTTNTGTFPSISAQATNNGFVGLQNISFVAVVFDPSGNAFAASGTQVPDLEPQAQTQITFTWPVPFPEQVGRIDIIPLLPPVPAASSGSGS